MVIDDASQSGRTLVLSGGNFQLSSPVELLRNGVPVDPQEYRIRSGNEIEVSMPAGMSYGEYSFQIRLAHAAGALSSNTLSVRFQATPAEVQSIVPSTGASGGVFSPNTRIDIAGRALCRDASSEPLRASSVPWPDELAGCRVLINGIPAPLGSVEVMISISGETLHRLVAVVPAIEVRDEPPVLTVQRLDAVGGIDAISSSVPLGTAFAATAPSLFLNPDGTAQAVNQTTEAPVTAAEGGSIGPGDTIRVSGTGFGRVLPALAPIQTWIKLKVGVGSDSSWTYVECEVVDARESSPGIVAITLKTPLDLATASEARAYLIIKSGDATTDEIPTFVTIPKP